MAVMRRFLQGVRIAFWLGIQVESNWTDPFLFVVYTVVRPLTGVLLLFAYEPSVEGAYAAVAVRPSPQPAPPSFLHSSTLAGPATAIPSSLI